MKELEMLKSVKVTVVSPKYFEADTLLKAP